MILSISLARHFATHFKTIMTLTWSCPAAEFCSFFRNFENLYLISRVEVKWKIACLNRWGSAMMEEANLGPMEVKSTLKELDMFNRFPKHVSLATMDVISWHLLLGLASLLIKFHCFCVVLHLDRIDTEYLCLAHLIEVFNPFWLFLYASLLVSFMLLLNLQ